MEFADALAEVIENDPRPKLAVGDFNMPNHGRVYHRMTRNLSDAFEESGRGYGFTMPGKTRNPLALFGHTADIMDNQRLTNDFPRLHPWVQ